MICSSIKVTIRFVAKVLSFFACIPALYSEAQNIALPGFFSNNMVLQRDKPIKFWGTALAKTSFRLEFAAKEKTVRVNENGVWQTEFPAMKAGGPYELKIVSDHPIFYKNILIGDVWLASGQSNMEFKLGNTDSVAYDLRENASIRCYTTPTAFSNYPQSDMRRMDWQLCTKETAPSFTAVGYYFAQKINKETGVPIGIIHTSWGGTSIKAWISEEGIAAVPEYKFLLDTFLQRRGTRYAIDSILQRNYAITASNNKNIADADAGYGQLFEKGEKGTRQWSAIRLPGTWQTGSLRNFDGVLWFRKEVELPADISEGSYTIQYGRIMGVSEMYVNGTKIGANSYKRSNSRFYLPPHVLVPGKNTLVIRVIDNDTAASFLSSKETMTISSVMSDHPFDLNISGDWEYTTTLTGSEMNTLVKSTETAPPNTTVSSIYNVKISPLTPLPIKGVLWYQGENDAPVGYFYRTLFTTMIKDWRKQFRQGDFPFLFAELPSFGSVKNSPVEDRSEWADIRESQASVLSLPHTAMAVALDVGDPADIHPHNKKPVGERLANEALDKVYGKKSYPLCPVMKSYTIRGSAVHIKFKDAQALAVRGGNELKGFAIAGDDKNFVWAKARIISKDEIVVSQEAVRQPLSVRYAWASSPVSANLINKDGSPAAPFRTDNWKLFTEGKIDNH